VGALESEHGEHCTLSTDHLVGRAPFAALQLNNSAVSWRHASIRWTGQVWELQDLGSLNGTFVNGTRVQAGTRVPLRTGAKLRFGDERSEWSVLDIDPPEACCVSLLDGSRIVAQGGLIALPNTETPEISLYRGEGGNWIAESAERVWQPQRNEILVATGQHFRFEPGSAALLDTTSNLQNQFTTDQITVEFVVSRNEEQVDVYILQEKKRIALKPRAHSYLLLTLARERLRDQAALELPPSSHGWVEQSRLARMLGTHLQQLTLDVYRARRQFAEAGLVDSAQIVERRSTSRELRIGVQHLSIVTS